MFSNEYNKNSSEAFKKAKSLMKVNIFYLYCLGIWPKMSKLIFFYGYYGYTYHFLKDFVAFYYSLGSHSLTRIISVGLECMSLTQVWVRYWMFKKYHEDFIAILKNFIKDYSIDNYKTEEEKKVFLQYNSISKKFITIVLVALYFTGGVYINQPWMRQASKL